MAAVVALWIVAASVIMAQIWAEPTTIQEVRVAGKVLCQDCTRPWSEWVKGTKPIKGGIVSITCMDQRRRVVHYASDVTDELGGFELNISSEVCAYKRLNPKLCRARLVSSPDYDCNILANFGGGHTGVALSWPTSIFHNSIGYTLHPFYFTTQTCQKPQQEEEDRVYQNNNNNDHY
ncbi:non-classical arabinogalactan protein 30 [Humulus lupulus]|uniref:non-classical arabinogalactan protein 30 n=1 Tax=Humulus lupulus TaxID=3486 RepID=UPI002B40184F|nr:non-classical arabinogalactan protein 30 [Humulus lupulus]